MEVICINCESIFDERESSLENGNKSSGLCVSCFITWLENFIKRIQAKGDPQNKLPFLRKLLTIKLIQRQEGGQNGK